MAVANFWRSLQSRAKRNLADAGLLEQVKPLVPPTWVSIFPTRTSLQKTSVAVHQSMAGAKPSVPPSVERLHVVGRPAQSFKMGDVCSVISDALRRAEGVNPRVSRSTGRLTPAARPRPAGRAVLGSLIHGTSLGIEGLTVQRSIC